MRQVNVDHHEPQFAFYLNGSILDTYIRLTSEEMMSTTTPVRSSLFTNAFARMQVFVNRIASPAAPTPGTIDLRQLYRMARGSDSVRPAVIRLLAANAAR